MRRQCQMDAQDGLGSRQDWGDFRSLVVRLGLVVSLEGKALVRACLMFVLWQSWSGFLQPPVPIVSGLVMPPGLLNLGPSRQGGSARVPVTATSLLCLVTTVPHRLYLEATVATT